MIRFLLSLFHGLFGCGTLCVRGFRSLRRPASFLNRWFVIPLLLAFFTTFKRIRDFWRRSTTSLGVRHRLPSVKSLAFKGAVVMVIFLTMRTNLFASDAANTVGTNTTNMLWFSSSNNSDLIEDSTPAQQPVATAGTSYLDPNTTLDQSLINIFENDQETSTDGGTDMPTMEDGTIQGLVILPGNAYGINSRQIQEYTVADGDTAGTIAEKFGVSTNTLVWENRLNSQAFLKPGQVLRILPVSGVSYTVKTGDTLASIAKKTGADSETILAFNDMEADQLIAGEVIIIPDGKIVASPVPQQARPSLRLTRNVLVPNDLPTSKTSLKGFVWPTVSRHINQYFTWRHSGLDIKGSTGVAIYAAQAGRVVLQGWNRGGYGNQVVLGHDQNTLTRYAHLSKILVKQGETVRKGQVIGLMGSTGRSTGPHLHFEVIRSGQRTNPLRIF